MTTRRTDSPLERLRGSKSRSFSLAGIVVLIAVGSSLGATFAPDQFFRAYLFAYIFWVGIPLGALVFAMIHPLVGGAWGAAIQPVAMAAVRTLPVTALLFVPLAFGLSHIYEWARPGSPVAFAYLTPTFFLARAACYFSVWIILSIPVVRWSESTWTVGGPAPNRLRVLCAVGLMLHFVVDSLAGVDWVMSLEPEYYSSNFGFVFISGQTLLALAFLVACVVWLRSTGVVADGPYLKERHLTYRDLGSLLATAVLLWAYLEYSQLIVNWTGDMAREAAWYVHRSTGGWQVVAALLVALNFGAPLFILLFRRVKDVPRHLALVGLCIVVMHVVDVLWFVKPSFGGGFRLHWVDLAAWAGVGVLWLAAFAFVLVNGRPVSILLPSAREGQP